MQNIFSVERFFSTIMIFMVVLFCSCQQESQKLTSYVDPLIGTGDHGHVFIGANVPFGAVQLGPTQFSEGWDWCSGYHYSDSTIIGFQHTHLSGAGSADLGDISLMPVCGEVKLTRGNLEDSESGIYSKFTHERETARAGYYSVNLDRFNIDVELTATTRVGFHRYTFNKPKDKRVIIDLEHGLEDTPAETFIVQENDSTISGYRTSTGWARHHTMYFTARFSQRVTAFETSGAIVETRTETRKLSNAYCIAHFDDEDNTPLLVKVALSPISSKNALMNLEEELPGWNFDQTVQEADLAWNAALNKIRIKSEDESVLRTFYTALFHTMVAPSVYCDVNRDYYGTDGEIHQDNDFINHSTFSLWDTYRTAHPLMNLIHPEKVVDIGKTMMHIFEEQGKLPVWHMMSNETNAMVGNPGAIVLADMVLKGFDIDNRAAYDALKTSAMLDERGMKWLKEYGYIPNDKESSSVAKALEYGLADWAIAQVAKKLGEDEDYDYFIARSKAYRHYFDPETKMLRPKDSEGNFRTPFDPISLADYREGNAWQYTWLVPHDISGLVSLFGSENAFIAQLDSLFLARGELKNALDVTGLIGQYAHGNEPSHHILYLYNYVGQPWKTAEKVRHVLTNLYSDKPAGISGNEDVGQMSAWYILSALGMYPVAPAAADFVFGSPIVDEAVIKLAGDKTFKIRVKNQSSDNIYIQEVFLNGEKYTKSYISFTDLMSGGDIVFKMGPKPSPTFGIAIADRPFSREDYLD